MFSDISGCKAFNHILDEMGAAWKHCLRYQMCETSTPRTAPLRILRKRRNWNVPDFFRQYHTWSTFWVSGHHEQSHVGGWSLTDICMTTSSPTSFNAASCLESGSRSSWDWYVVIPDSGIWSGTGKHLYSRWWCWCAGFLVSWPCVVPFVVVLVDGDTYCI